MRGFILLLTMVGVAVTAERTVKAEAAQKRPNILWIIVDDMSADFGCYGADAVATPNVDRLAQRGTRFSQAFVTAPVCSTCRSAFITGMYQTSIGAHHHRSGRGQLKIQLPPGVTPIPVLFQRAGYHTSVGSWPIRAGRLGKTDYNFEWDRKMYDGPDWGSRREGQPFFAQIQLRGGKLRGGTRESAEKFAQRVAKRFGKRTAKAAVKLPPYYPAEETIVHDWAAYLDSVRETDRIVGEILARLRREKLLQSTVVIFLTDHGISHARGKQFLYDEGIHIPLIVAGPGIRAGATRSDLVEHIDIAAISLALAGIPIPPKMQARNVFATDYRPRKAVFAARDRCDETVDHLRCVRTARFKYIRNFLPNRPHLQPNAYKDHKSILIALRAAHAAGRLNSVQQALFAPTRPREELYDLQADPYEIKNLAAEPTFAATLKRLRRELDDWMEQTGDHGRTPESMRRYDSEMRVYLDALQRRGRAGRLEVLKRNIQLMKDWAAAGK